MVQTNWRLLALVRSQFLFLLLLTLGFSLPEFTESFDYFQEAGRITSQSLAFGKSLTTSSDGRYILITTEDDEGKSTIQAYHLLRNPSFLIEPIGIIDKSYSNKTLQYIGNLLLRNDTVYTISKDESQSSCLISSFKVEGNGTLTAFSGLSIPTNPSIKGLLAGFGNKLFSFCRDLTSIEIDNQSGELKLKDSPWLDEPDSRTVSNLTYVESIHRLFLTFSVAPDEIGEQNQKVISAFDVSQNGSLHHLKLGALAPLTESGIFYSLTSLYLPKFLFIYVGTGAGGYFLTFNLEEKPLRTPSENSLPLTILDFILSLDGSRLFYTSKPFSIDEHHMLGAIGVNSAGEVANEISAISLAESYSKLAMLPDGCHLLAIAPSTNSSVNGSLVLYRINDPAIGCAPAKSETFMIVGSISFGILMITTGLVVTYLCYWLRKRGARKGYTPVGEPDY